MASAFSTSKVETIVSRQRRRQKLEFAQAASVAA
jgi:hypothetical protein